LGADDELDDELDELDELLEDDDVEFASSQLNEAGMRPGGSLSFPNTYR